MIIATGIRHVLTTIRHDFDMKVGMFASCLDHIEEAAISPVCAVQKRPLETGNPELHKQMISSGFFCARAGLGPSNLWKRSSLQKHQQNRKECKDTSHCIGLSQPNSSDMPACLVATSEGNQLSCSAY